ncbi:hypothetical protein RHMOL_Rhmol07G0049500 [Rhododendron molle]|uniref:Uncharacterized protein n=1 Tax=Rhododendron molle TaxID=49168 RepID=A0ACC0MX58_RHOML|nr:hypothetical protein RHMOL_Rhmol07G0049500 [Rhododendron molle]
MKISDLSPSPSVLSPSPSYDSPDDSSYDRSEYYALFNWNVWDIRAFVLLSMFLHCFLFACASERRRTNKTWLLTLISSAYFLADWVAPYTIGLISVRLSKICDSDKERARHYRYSWEITDENSWKSLFKCNPYGRGSYQYAVTTWYLRFWAPFLLLHLGGPDNVTSLSAEENNMWLQQLIRMISQIVSTIVIFIRFAPYFGFNWTSHLILLAGTIRCMERVHSLYLARSGGLKESSATQVKLQAGPDFEKLSEVQWATREANLPTQVERVQLPPKKFKPHSPILRGDVELVFDTDNDQLDENSLLQFALCFYNNFKGLFFGGVSYNHEQRHFTRDFFLRRSSRDAFKLAEIELSFIHKDLHTKTGTPHLDGNPVARIITLLLISAAAFRLYQIGFFDPWVLDSSVDSGISYALIFGALIIEIVSLLMVLLSGRNVVAFNYYIWVKPIANAMVNMRKWKESFSKCNFICYHLRHRTPRQRSFIAEFLFIGPALEAWKLKRTVTSDPVLRSLKDKIFTELKMRSELARNVEIATKICSQRGDWILMQRSCYRKLKWSLGEVEYGRSFLLWHIATDLVCYNSKDCDNGDRRFCKDISEYLLYLFLAKPTMIAPASGNSVKIFQDTSLEAQKLFRKRSITSHDQACQAILSVNTDLKPTLLKGDASESVLFDACILAKQLSGFNEDKRWSLMSGVWMELLTYAAFHSKGTDHAHQPSRGGELLTFVWLLMNHLGLGMQFCDERARTGYRVVVKK